MEKLVRIFAAGVVALASLVVSATPRYSVKMTVENYGGSTTLENFPVLVKVAKQYEVDGPGIEGFDYADMTSPSTGADLWFSTDAAGANVIPHDIDEWHEGGTSLVWVSDLRCYRQLSTMPAMPTKAPRACTGLIFSRRTRTP